MTIGPATVWEHGAMPEPETVPVTPMSPELFDAPLRTQFEVFLYDHRFGLAASLDGLTEEQARRPLVSSKTTLLGLIKHATFVERVWFDEAITGRSRVAIGIVATPDESFDLDDLDTIASVRNAHAAACADSRRRVATLDVDDMVTGNKRGRFRCVGCTCVHYANSPSTKDMPTSFGSRFLVDESSGVCFGCVATSTSVTLGSA